MMAGKSVAVIGLGHVGLPLACALADSGLRTTGIEVDERKVRLVNKGTSPLHGREPGLEEILRRVVGSGALIATTDPSECSRADAIFVCVETPIDEDKNPVLDPLTHALAQVGRSLRKGCLVSVESTIPPGTMLGKVIPILDKESGMRAGRDFSVVHCPERVMPGVLLRNLRSYERVMGGLDDASLEKGLEFYSSIVRARIHTTDLTSAEITKTVENAYRDVQIAFANEVAVACEELGADAYEVRRLVNTCPFRDMHLPGSGVGGHCVPKDPWLFVSSVARSPTSLIETARAVNDSMPRHLTSLVLEALRENGRKAEESKVTVLGLSFLRDSGDVRNSPAIPVIDALVERSDVVVHDPFAADAYRAPLLRDVDEALKGSDCAVFVTDHSAYSALDLERIGSLMRTKAIVDGRNIFDSSECRRHGFAYKGIGKGK